MSSQIDLAEWRQITTRLLEFEQAGLVTRTFRRLESEDVLGKDRVELNAVEPHLRVDLGELDAGETDLAGDEVVSLHSIGVLREYPAGIEFCRRDVPSGMVGKARVYEPYDLTYHAHLEIVNIARYQIPV